MVVGETVIDGVVAPPGDQENAALPVVYSCWISAAVSALFQMEKSSITPFITYVIPGETGFAAPNRLVEVEFPACIYE